MTKPDSSRNPLSDAQDCLTQIDIAHEAVVALEYFVTPIGAQDREEIQVTRTQLGSLLSVLNQNMEHWIRRAEGHMKEHFQTRRKGALK